jgi:hypothetical protein
VNKREKDIVAKTQLTDQSELLLSEELLCTRLMGKFVGQ